MNELNKEEREKALRPQADSSLQRLLLERELHQIGRAHV